MFFKASAAARQSGSTYNSLRKAKRKPKKECSLTDDSEASQHPSESLGDSPKHSVPLPPNDLFSPARSSAPKVQLSSSCSTPKTLFSPSSSIYSTTTISSLDSDDVGSLLGSPRLQQRKNQAVSASQLVEEALDEQTSDLLETVTEARQLAYKVLSLVPSTHRTDVTEEDVNQFIANVPDRRKKAIRRLRKFARRMGEISHIQTQLDDLQALATECEQNNESDENPSSVEYFRQAVDNIQEARPTKKSSDAPLSEEALLARLSNGSIQKDMTYLGSI